MKEQICYKVVFVGKRGTMWSSNLNNNLASHLLGCGSLKRIKGLCDSENTIRYRLRKTITPEPGRLQALFVLENLRHMAEITPRHKYYVLKGLATNTRPILGKVITKEQDPAVAQYGDIHCRPFGMLCDTFTPISIIGKVIEGVFIPFIKTTPDLFFPAK